MRQPHINTCSVPRLSQSLASFARSGGAAALLNLLPCLIVCLWHLAIRPGFSIVIRDHLHHPALIGFHEPELSAIGVYRWSMPDAALLVPGYALPGVLSFVGVPAPDGTRVILPFPGTAFEVELPHNDGEMPLRRYAILWPERAALPGAVVVPIKAHVPLVSVEERPLGLLVRQLEAFPVKGSGQAPASLLIGLVAVQLGYGITAHRLFNRSVRQSLIMSLGIGLAFATASLVVAWFTLPILMFTLGLAATVASLRMAWQKRWQFGLIVIAFLALSGVVSFLFDSRSFFSAVWAVFAGLVAYLLMYTERKIYLTAVILLCGITIFVNGVGLLPSEHFQKLAQNPFILRYDIEKENYWQENVLLPLISYYTRSNDRFGFNALCFLLNIMSYALLLLLSIRRYGEIPALLTTATIVTGQLTTITFSWIGMPDSLTILLTVPLLFIQSPLLIGFLSFLGSTNHLVYLIAGFIIIVARRVSSEKIGFIHLIALLVGSSLGYLCVRLFLFYHNITIVSRVDVIVNMGFDALFDFYFGKFFWNFFLFFGVQWLVLVASFAMFFLEDKRFYLTSALIVVASLFITFFFGDTTRVFQLITWGFFAQLLYHSCVLAEKSRYGRAYIYVMIIVIVLSVILPRFYSFAGSIYATPYTRVL